MGKGRAITTRNYRYKEGRSHCYHCLYIIKPQFPRRKEKYHRRKKKIVITNTVLHLYFSTIFSWPFLLSLSLSLSLSFDLYITKERKRHLIIRPPWFILESRSRARCGELLWTHVEKGARLWVLSSLSLSLIKSLNGTFCAPGILYFSFHSFFLRLYFIYFYPFKLVSSGVALRRQSQSSTRDSQTWPTVCNYTSPHFSFSLLPFCASLLQNFLITLRCSSTWGQHEVLGRPLVLVVRTTVPP